MLLPTNLVEKNDVGFQECFMVECCPYYGLRFAPMCANKLASFIIFIIVNVQMFILVLFQSA
jgi:hypothetical protein